MKKILCITFLFVCCSCQKQTECFSPPEPFRLVVRHTDNSSSINASNQQSVHLLLNDASSSPVAVEVLSY